MSEGPEEIARLRARVREVETAVEDLLRRLRAVEATLERAERAAIRREARERSARSRSESSPRSYS